MLSIAKLLRNPWFVLVEGLVQSIVEVLHSYTVSKNAYELQ